MRVLNVGGSNRTIPIPAHYAGWTHLLLDIDPRGIPDIVCDARELMSLPAGEFDAVYCAHNLEHYYRHDVRRVLRGFRHLLNDDGFAEIIVPDVRMVMQRVMHTGMDIEDVLYMSAAGAITARDVLYGSAVEIERSGQDFFAHKTGFTAKSLSRALHEAGFATIAVKIVPDAYELAAIAFKSAPRPDQRALFGLPQDAS